MKPTPRTVVGVVLLIVAITQVRGAVMDWQDFADARAVCDSAAANDLEKTRAAMATLKRPGDAHRLASECICITDVIHDDPATCVERLVPYVTDLDDGWVPDPDVVAAIGGTLMEQDRWPLAKRLAEAVLTEHPFDVPVTNLWLDAASLGAGDDDRQKIVLERAAAAPDDNRTKLQLAVAQRRRLKGDATGCLEALKGAPIPTAVVDQKQFLLFKSSCLAVLNRRQDIVRLWDEWVAAGADRTEADALLTLATMYGHVAIPEDFVRLQRLDEEPGKLSLDLRRSLSRSLILQLANNPNGLEAAREVLARAQAQLDLAPDVVAELARALEGANVPDDDAMTTLTFRLQSPVAGASVLVSPPPDQPVDSAPEQVRIVAGVANVARTPSRAPVRWVLLDGDGAVRGSGALWVKSGTTNEVQIVPQAPQPRETFQLPTPRPGDGRRRVFVLIPDSWDWRLLGLLRARGELPVVDALIDNGTSAVLWSDPPMTATAMAALAYPARDEPFGVLALVHEMGEELGGLAAVGENPLAFMSPWLSARPSLFSTVGGEQRVVANLLFSHADIDAGRNAERTGPKGERRLIPIQRSSRPLHTNELATIDGPMVGPDPLHFSVVAAQLDLFGELIDDGTDDLILLRAEAVDLLTHHRLNETSSGRQDNAVSTLYGMYRFIDFRLREILPKLDADDVLVVMSDHGALTSLQHDHPAVFLMWGAGATAMRVPGTPSLRGVPRLLADLLGVPSNFPETGLAATLPGPVAPPQPTLNPDP